MSSATLRRLLAGISGALLLSFSSPALGQTTSASSPTAAPVEDGADWSEWISTLAESQENVRSLRATVAKMEAEVSRMRSRRYPRGEERARLLTASERASSELEEAETRHPELLEEARQAGVPQGLLQDFEAIPAAAP
jgi:hypothetical protein